MTSVVPCPLCGYEAPESACPHCGRAPVEPSLARPLAGPVTGVLDGFVALPVGLRFLLRTRGIKRWLAPPLVLTATVLVAALWWTFQRLDALLDRALGSEIELDPASGWPGRFLAEHADDWGWLASAWAGLVAAFEWSLNLGWSTLSAPALHWLLWFLVGSLVMWYCFSIAYEAFAGPFLDEIHGRLEARWFGEDPRNRLERPNDITSKRCLTLSTWAATASGALLLALLWLPDVPWYLAVLAAPTAVIPFVLLDRRYGEWLFWLVRIEGRASLASLEASIVTGVLIVLALPLYFVPGAGYFLFAGVCGFATAVGLLDIPFERRGWSMHQRVRFVFRNLLPLLAFGVVSGLLLAVPVLGPLLMVPSASIGGLWLVCRLDKRALRPAGSPVVERTPPPREAAPSASLSAESARASAGAASRAAE